MNRKAKGFYNRWIVKPSPIYGEKEVMFYLEVLPENKESAVLKKKDDKEKFEVAG
jgi:hypothetical protein